MILTIQTIPATSWSHETINLSVNKYIDYLDKNENLSRTYFLHEDGPSAEKILEDIYDATISMRYEGLRESLHQCTSTINITSLMYVVPVTLERVKFYDEWEFEDILKYLYVRIWRPCPDDVSIEDFFNKERLRYFNLKYPFELTIVDNKDVKSFKTFGRDTLRVMYPGMDTWRSLGKPTPDVISRFSKEYKTISGEVLNKGQILINNRPVK